MSQRKKKQVQYFFVDINDPDYYKRIKVARACIDCRKRKSKCDIGVPGSGPCSGCRKHNKVCEFTTNTIASPTPPTRTPPSGPKAQVAQAEIKRRKNQKLYQRRQQSRYDRHQIYPSSSPVDYDFNQSIYTPTISLAVTPENAYNGTSLYATGENDGVGVGGSVTTQMHVDLPVFRLEKNECPSLPTTPPLSLSSPSMLSSTTTTPSPPLHTDDAYGTTFPWQSSDTSCPDMEISMHSVTFVDPPKIDLPPPPPLSNMLEYELFQIYLQHIHPLYPVLSASTLRHTHNTLPLCLRHAIMALAFLYYQPQTSSTIHLAYDYYTKSSKELQLCEVNSIAVVQTLLILYKYHETMGDKTHEYFLESARANLEKLVVNPSDGDDDTNKEWVCRLQWIIFLHQFGDLTTSNSSWHDPPAIRLPCLLPSEQHDTHQLQAISKLLDAIHIANVYSSAIQSLCISSENSWVQASSSLS